MRSDPQYVHYREAVDDVERMKAHAEYRNRVFVPPRPLDSYVGAMEAAGFEVLDVREETIEARVSEWFEFLSAYHDAVLGWVGGPEPTPGRAARPPAPDPPRDGDAVRRPPVVQRLLDLHHRAQAVLTGPAVNLAACLPPHGR